MATPTFQPNPYANFDPSQWTNPYSQFSGKALPWPSSYAGMPTNALGQPIAAPPGMTLNSTPASAPQAPVNQGQWAINNAMINGMASGLNPAAGGGFTNPNAAATLGNIIGARTQNNQAYGASAPGGAVPTPANVTFGGQAPQAGVGAAGPGQPSYQQVLAMLANPGPVQTPGATAPQAQNATALQPGVLQSFLANWKPQSSGPGSGFTQNFNTILRGLQGQKGS